MKPVVKKCEDGSILIEFIDRKWRFYICLEEKLEESSWGLIINGNKLKLENLSVGGELSREFINLIDTNKLRGNCD